LPKWRRLPTLFNTRLSHYIQITSEYFWGTGSVLVIFLRQKVDERAMEAMSLDKHFQSLGCQTVKILQSLNKYLIIWAIRIELGNFLFDVEISHENLLEQGVKP
jgi:hypothetical protein